jgi:hypothetical protein
MTQCEKEYCQEREQGKKILDQARFQHEVLAEIHELTDPRSKTPLQDMQMIRIKAAVALRAAAQSGMLS